MAKTLYRFQVVAGVHIEGGREYKTGEIITSPHDLTATFRGKFRPLDDVQSVASAVGPSVGAPVPATPENPDQTSGNDANADKKAPPAGKDVSDEFPIAGDEDYKVFQLDDETFNVYDADDLASPVNAEPLKTKSAVTKAIKADLE